MNIVSFGLIITGVLLNAIAQLALKASVRQMGEIKLSMVGAWPVTQQLMLEPALWLGLFCYGISVIIWILALSRVDVSIAYPMLSIGYIVNALFAWLLFGEALTLERLVGIGVIIVGVYILARS
ncbi:MAG: SMR family transporter [Gammaproteobacteria bacterium]